jgi:mannose-6-phosphate isomerase
VQGGQAVELEQGFSVVVVTAGAGRLASAGGELDLRAGSTVLVPWAAGPVTVTGDLALVRCRPPA